jgi:hypothetical protein
VERAPDPTLAIKFLAEAGQLPEPAQSWPDPAFSAPAVQDTPAFGGASSPFQAAGAPDSAPVPAVEPPTQVSAFEPVREFQPAVPLPEPAAVAEAPPSPAFVPVEAPAPEPPAKAEPPAETKVPDTDRVDDLLRQFRERYGRGTP